MIAGISTRPKQGINIDIEIYRSIEGKK